MDDERTDSRPLNLKLPTSLIEALRREAGRRTQEDGKTRHTMTSVVIDALRKAGIQGGFRLTAHFRVDATNAAEVHVELRPVVERALRDNAPIVHYDVIDAAGIVVATMLWTPGAQRAVIRSVEGEIKQLDAAMPEEALRAWSGWTPGADG